MVLPKALARFNRVVTNRVLGLAAGWMPGFGIVLHRGRRTGREYRTPVGVFTTPDGYVIPLTYGPGTDWVKNVLAAHGCELETRGRHVKLTDPRIVRDETRRAAPPVIRWALAFIGAADFLYLATEPSG